METQPYMPPAPPAPKKDWGMSWKWIIGLLIVGVIVASVTQTKQDEPTTTNTDVDSSLQTDTQLQIMRLVWDTEITATDRANICDYYNTPPVGTTPEMVEIFAEGADMSYAEAEPLLNQLLAEKC